MNELHGLSVFAEASGWENFRPQIIIVTQKLNNKEDAFISEATLSFKGP